MVYALSEIWCTDGSRSPLPEDWPLFSLADAHVGLTFGPASVLIDETVMDRYARAMGTETPLYPTVPAKIVDLLRSPKVNDLDAVSPALNAGMAMELVSPVQVGDVITVRGEITHMYEKRGKPYAVGQSETVNQRGEVIDRLRKTWVLSKKSVAEKWDFLREEPLADAKENGASTNGHDPASERFGEIEVADGVNEPLETSTRFSIGQRIAQNLIDYSVEHVNDYQNVVPRYAGRSLHHNDAAAKKAGFSQPFASGGMMVAHVIENLLPPVFGRGWMHHGALSIMNTRPILLGSQVLLTADVAAKLPHGFDKTVMVVSLKAVLPSGDTVAVGSASALVPA